MLLCKNDDDNDVCRFLHVLLVVILLKRIPLYHDPNRPSETRILGFYNMARKKKKKRVKVAKPKVVPWALVERIIPRHHWKN